MKTGWAKLFSVMTLSVMLAGCGKDQAAAPVGDLLQTGWQQYRLGEFKRALGYFEKLAATSRAGSENHLQAQFGLATTYNLRRPDNDPQKAKTLFEEIIKTSPTNDLAAWSLLALARMQHLGDVDKTPDYVAVRKSYQDVMDRFPGHLASKEAFIYYNATLIASLEDDKTRQALSSLEGFVQREKKEFLQPAWSLLAIGYTTIGDPEKRLQAEIKSLETTEVDPTNPFNDYAWALWNIATLAEFELGDFVTARTYYERLIKEYPRDIRIHGARTGLKRMNDLENKLRAEKGGA